MLRPWAAWHDFYLMLGPTAGALIGLLFVVVTLTAGMERKKVAKGMAVFLSPTVFHLGAVVFLSVAWRWRRIWNARMLAGLVLACGLDRRRLRHLHRPRPDRRRHAEATPPTSGWYSVAVGVLYAGLVVAGGLLF